MYCIGCSMKNLCSCKGFSVYSGYHFQIQKSTSLLKFKIDFRRVSFQTFVVIRSFSKEHFSGTLQLMTDEKSYLDTQSEMRLGVTTEYSSKSILPQDSLQDFQCRSSDLSSSDSTDNSITPLEGAQMISDKEVERRMKIGKANKGKTPWNKGIKHSEETRERISKRTREALSDPKVKEKMSNCHAHSDQSKAKISAALTKIWKMRLNHKRSQERWLLLWRRTIAEVAKVGTHDQQELEWDSYEKLKAETVSEHLKLRAEKARSKEIARLRAERVARHRAKVAKLSQQNKKREQKAGVDKPNSRNKPGLPRKKNTLSVGLKLSRRLAKFHNIKKQLEALKSLQVEKITKTEPCTETWDLELIKTEIERRKVPLAEQIQAVKDRRVDFAALNGISHISFGDKVVDN